MTTCQNDESLFKGRGKVDVTCVGSQRPTNEKSTSFACATQTSSGKQPFIMSQDNDNIPHPVRVPLASFFPPFSNMRTIQRRFEEIAKAVNTGLNISVF